MYSDAVIDDGGLLVSVALVIEMVKCDIVIIWSGPEIMV